MNSKSYLIGYFLGGIIIWSLYLMGLVGIVLDIKNGNLPFAPLIFMLCLSTWRKSIQSSEILRAQRDANIINNIFNNAKAKRETDLDKLMDKINKLGGPN